MTRLLYPDVFKEIKKERPRKDSAAGCVLRQPGEVNDLLRTELVKLPVVVDDLPLPRRVAEHTDGGVDPALDVGNVSERPFHRGAVARKIAGMGTVPFVTDAVTVVVADDPAAQGGLLDMPDEGRRRGPGLLEPDGRSI